MMSFCSEVVTLVQKKLGFKYMYFNITQILKSRTFITNWMSLPLYPDFNYIGMLKKF